MPNSIALDILLAMQARFGVASVVIDGVTFNRPAGLTVERERIGRIGVRQILDGPHVVLHMGGQQPTERKHHASKMLVRTLEVLLTITALANDVSNSEAVDPPTNWIVQSLQSEPRLGGLCEWISEEGQEDFYTTFEESNDVIAVREMMMHVRFHTRTENPETRS